MAKQLDTKQVMDVFKQAFGTVVGTHDYHIYNMERSYHNANTKSWYFIGYSLPTSYNPDYIECSYRHFAGHEYLYFTWPQGTPERFLLHDRVKTLLI